MRRTLFPEPKTDSELWMEIAFQHGLSLGHADGFEEGYATAQGNIQNAHLQFERAMGKNLEELGA